MKLTSMYDAVKNRKEGVKTPKRTLRELATEFNISATSLAMILSKDDAPKPVLINGTVKSGRVADKKWYEPSEVRAYMKEYTKHHKLKTLN
jgi:hypothetical protein